MAYVFFFHKLKNGLCFFHGKVASLYRPALQAIVYTVYNIIVHIILHIDRLYRIVNKTFVFLISEGKQPTVADQKVLYQKVLHFLEMSCPPKSVTNFQKRMNVTKKLYKFYKKNEFHQLKVFKETPDNVYYVYCRLQGSWAEHFIIFGLPDLTMSSRWCIRSILLEQFRDYQSRILRITGPFIILIDSFRDFVQFCSI